MMASISCDVQIADDGKAQHGLKLSSAVWAAGCAAATIGVSESVSSRLQRADRVFFFFMGNILLSV